MNALAGRLGRVACFVAVTATAACGSDSKDSPVEPDGGAGPEKLAVTADYLHRTLSFIDFEKIVSDPTAGTAARQEELDLSQYEQPPYGVKLTPDGRTAVVTHSAGFFIVPGASQLLLGDPTVPTGPSKVLIIDVASKTVRAELDVDTGAAGISITHDGKLAFVTHTGTSNMSVIDIEAGAIKQVVDIGGSFAEAVEVDETDTVGVITCLNDGLAKSARTFAVADPGTLSDSIPLQNDAAGVAFFPGTKTAFVVLAYAPVLSPLSGIVLVDASDPLAPVKLGEERWTDAIYVAFEAFAEPRRGTVFMPVSHEANLEMREYALEGDHVTIKNRWPVTQLRGFGPFGTAFDRNGRMLMTLPGNREIAVLDIRDGKSFTAPWFPEPGPMGIDLY